MIYLIQENGVMTLLGWNVDLFKFSDRWQLSCETKKEELMLIQYSH